jgi:hypothetical protein
MVEIDKKLYQEIKDYCKLNNLVIKDFVNKLLRKALTVEKYGDKPFSHENGTIVDNKKKQNGIIPEVTPEAIWVPYVTEEVVTTVVDLDPSNVELPEKLKERYGKVDDKFYGKIQVDGLLEKESNGKIGKMELPDEPPYNNVMVTTEHTDYKTPEPVETVVDISKKEVPNNFYGTLQYDESWEEKLEENIEKGLIVTIPYRIETNGTMITVNHSKKEKTSETTDTSSSTEEKEEMKPIKKSRKRKLN